MNHAAPYGRATGLLRCVGPDAWQEVLEASRRAKERRRWVDLPL